MKNIHKLEFWSDSFHEGNWACIGLSKIFKIAKIEYIYGFIPCYFFDIDENNSLEIIVFGSYKNWDPLPSTINQLLNWGKPDLIIYDPSAEKIILAVEETAAVPTGNQALQRCERQYGSARAKIPFWYLLSEFGLHADGGVRTDSIWPTILAIKLSCITHVPSMVLHYADLANPENYDMGLGLEELFQAISIEIKLWTGISDENSILLPLLERQYSDMLKFLDRQWHRITNYMPGADEMIDPKTVNLIAKSVLKLNDGAPISFKNFLTWGTTETLPKEIYNNIHPGGLIKFDPFIQEIEKIVNEKKGYNLSIGVGSRPQPKSSVVGWILAQKNLFDSLNKTDAQFKMSIEDFPVSEQGNVHITTAKNVLYLFDKWADVFKALSSAYPRISKQEYSFSYESDIPVFVYISNSMEPGRIFGDPFTGQLAAYANIFSRDLTGTKNRIVLTYYPHQVHTQLFTPKGTLKQNKGTAILNELVDVAVFNSGVIINFSDLKII